MWDTEIADLRDTLESSFPQVEHMTGAEARAAVAARRMPVTNLDDVREAVDIEIPSSSAGPIPARVYHPRSTGQPRPMIVFFHGGGFVFCDIESHDGFCRAMSKGTTAVVVSVGYRLAPEHKAPAAAEDAHTAVRWAARHAAEYGGDPARILTAGDSAGGNLAAVACLMAYDRGDPQIAGQLLIYPVIDSACAADSHRRYATGFYNTNAAMRWYWRQYLDNGRLPEPEYYAAPLTAPTLARLPPAVVVIAGTDPLADEGRAYADAMRESGVPVVHREYGGLFHGFVTFMTLRAGRSAREQLWRDTSALLAERDAAFQGANT